MIWKNCWSMSIRSVFQCLWNGYIHVKICKIFCRQVSAHLSTRNFPKWGDKNFHETLNHWLNSCFIKLFKLLNLAGSRVMIRWFKLRAWSPFLKLNSVKHVETEACLDCFLWRKCGNRFVKNWYFVAFTYVVEELLWWWCTLEKRKMSKFIITCILDHAYAFSVNCI